MLTSLPGGCFIEKCNCKLEWDSINNKEWISILIMNGSQSPQEACGNDVVIYNNCKQSADSFEDLCNWRYVDDVSGRYQKVLE